MPNPPPVKRVAILGGGVAALSAAAELVQQQAQAGHTLYEITLYQLGRRLGGKGASSRNRSPGKGMRIEEHGLHVWFGCYHRAWRLLRRCYDALGRGEQMAELFQGQTDTPYMEDVGGWKVWPVHFPRKFGTLGDDSLRQDVLGYVHAIGRFLLELGRRAAARRLALGGDEPLWLQRLRAGIDDAVALFEQRLRALEQRAADPAAPARPPGEHYDALLAAEALGELVFGAASSDLDDELRRARILFELGATALRGLWADRVWHTGFDALDGEDARAWFRRHGASQPTLDAAPIRALYDLCFAYRGGRVDWAQADFAAGAALVTVLRIVIEYADYVVYEMRAGMGEVVIAPLYRYLRSQGVRFCFFHQLDRLELDAQARSVAAVHLTQQAQTLDGAEYEPLFELAFPGTGLHPLECWPDTPKYELLRDGDALKGYDLESRHGGWPAVGPVTLRAGADYDLLVLGVSLESAREVCADFAGALPAWRTMFDAMRSVQTVSAQLWMTATLQQLGWTHGAVPIDAGPEPLDVWADRSDLLQREGWGSDAPHSLQYLCGPLDESWTAGLPPGPAFALAGKAAALRTTRQWLEQNAGALWPASVVRGAFDWNTLYAPIKAGGAARLESQVVRANFEPSERYVLSVAGSTASRLKAGGSGLANLILAGDWTHSDWNAGCIEAAVASGTNAAAAVAAS